jgi:hypothetical protein
MIRLLLGAVLGWAAWRNRSRIKEYVNRFPKVQTRATGVLERIKEGLQAAPDAARPSPLAAGREGQPNR